MGVQSEQIALSAELSDAAREALPSLLAAIVRQLETWGHRAEPQTQGPSA